MTSFRQNIAGWIAIIASLALYIASLGMPALEFANHEPVKGYVTLLWGWWGLLMRDFPWLANPIYFLALFVVLAGDKKAGQVLSVLAFGVGMLSLWTREWSFDESQSTPIRNLGSAFYCWMASFLVLLLLLFFAKNQVNSASRGKNPKNP